jgi:hypothetical protein
MEEKRCAYRILVVKPKEKRPLGRFRNRWEDNTKIELQKVGSGSINWINVAQLGTGGGTCECGNEPSIKCEEFLE